MLGLDWLSCALVFWSLYKWEFEKNHLAHIPENSYGLEKTSLSRRRMSLLLPPPHPHLPSKSCLCFPVFLCFADRAYWQEKWEERVGEEPNHTTARSLILYKLFNTLCLTVIYMYVPCRLTGFLWFSPAGSSRRRDHPELFGPWKGNCRCRADQVLFSQYFNKAVFFSWGFSNSMYMELFQLYVVKT